MLTFTLPPEQPRALTVPLGRTVDRRAAWRERAEAAHRPHYTPPTPANPPTPSPADERSTSRCVMELTRG